MLHTAVPSRSGLNYSVLFSVPASGSPTVLQRAPAAHQQNEKIISCYSLAIRGTTWAARQPPCNRPSSTRASELAKGCSSRTRSVDPLRNGGFPFAFVLTMAVRFGLLTVILSVCLCAAYGSPAKTLGAGRSGGGEATILDLHEMIAKRLGQHVWDPGAAAQEALRAVLDAASTSLTGDGHRAIDMTRALEIQIISHIKSLADAHTPSDAFIVLTELVALASQLPRHHPVLVLRRAIIAALILHSSVSPLDERAQSMALHLLRHLYLRHRVTASSRLAVEFAHVSKSGGTTLCRLAQHNGCRTQGFALDTNCLITDFQDQVRHAAGGDLARVL